MKTQKISGVTVNTYLFSTLDFLLQVSCPIKRGYYKYLYGNRCIRTPKYILTNFSTPKETMKYALLEIRNYLMSQVMDIDKELARLEVEDL